MKIRIVLALLTILFFFGGVIDVISADQVYEPIAELTLKDHGGGVRPAYDVFIAQYLAEIGIKVNIVIVEWIIFCEIITETYDFDLTIVSLTSVTRDPDLSSIYSVNDSLNLFGLKTSIPYVQESEDMLKEGVEITNIAERQNHYYKWQQLMMDKIIPILPLYSPRLYVASWSTLTGYNCRWSLTDNLPYMEFTDYHEGQSDTTELVVANSNWKEMNPILYDDSASQETISLISEPLLAISPGGEPFKTGIIYDWEQINESHYQFFMRDSIHWNPSYNVTERDSESISLDQAPLMQGLKNNDVSNGTNLQVTSKDAVFTLLANANPLINKNADNFAWINDIWVDSIDPLSFHVIIDGDPSTAELDLYAPFWHNLDLALLPDFFLNSSDATITYSSGGKDMKGIYGGINLTAQWQTYSISAFGCGKYMLDYSVNDSVTVLRASPYWFGKGTMDGTPQDLDIETVRIRVIPDLHQALEEFKLGKLDICTVTAFISERKEMQNDPLFIVNTKLSNSMTFIAFNLRRPFIGGEDNNVFLTTLSKTDYTKACAVRKAICYAINRDEMNLVIHDGEFLTVHSPINPMQTFWYYHDITKHRYHISDSKEWLEAAGYTIPTIITTETTPEKTETTSSTISTISVIFSLVPPTLLCLAKILRRRKI